MTKVSNQEAVKRYSSEARRLALSVSSSEELQAGAMMLCNTTLELKVAGLDDQALLDIMMAGVVSIGAVAAMEEIVAGLKSEDAAALFLSLLNERVTVYAGVAQRILADRPLPDATTRWPNLVWEVQ